MKKEHKHKTRMIKIKRKEEKRFHLPVILRRYGKADVFNDEMKDTFIPGELKGPGWLVATGTCCPRRRWQS